MPRHKGIKNKIAEMSIQESLHSVSISNNHDEMFMLLTFGTSQRNMQFEVHSEFLRVIRLHIEQMFNIVMQN